jgi:serine/threonine protein kinase
MEPGDQPPGGSAAEGTSGGPTDPSAEPAERLALAVNSLPDAGTTFLGFRLLAELGRGGFSRVFLARQAEFGDRAVALKVSVDLLGESHRLVQLQHTNIVPIYSAHSAGPLQAICMPYFGRTTLADVLAPLAGKTIPTSGEFLVNMLRSSVLRDVPAWVAAPASQATEPLARLEKLSYVEAVLWMTRQLAEGLSHAHERGIVHRDLKPANVLISDDGRPMLLDFNLSVNVKVQDGPRSPLVGTLPYMAPEHLETFQGGGRPVDARSDTYSLGVILYEALTGRLPFAMESGPVREVVPRLLARRPDEFVEVCPWNEAVTPAVESIVRRCLEYDPARRYQSAGDLAEDIHRHLDHLPLAHAYEPSLRERARKWARRHPRLASPGVLLLFVVVCLAAIAFWNVEKSAKDLAISKGETTSYQVFLQAQALVPAAMKLKDDLVLSQLHYGEGLLDANVLGDDLANARKLLNVYDVLRKKDWQKAPLVDALPELHKHRLRETLAELLFWSAWTYRDQGRLKKDQPARQELYDKAWQYSTLAEQCYPAEHVHRAILVQKAELARLLGKDTEAKKYQERADKKPADFFLQAFELASERKLQESIRILKNDVLRRDPQQFWAQLLLAVCLHNLAVYGYSAAHYEEAAAAYSTCLALRPDFSAGRLQRGWLHLKNPHGLAWRLSRADADDVLKRLGEITGQTAVPESHAAWASAHFLRARAIEQDVAEKCQVKTIDEKVQDECKRLLREEAIKDLTRALDFRPDDPAIYFLRAKMHNLLGDEKAVAADLAKVRDGHPSDAEGWAFRGRARLIDLERLEEQARQRDPKKAAVARAELARLDRRTLADNALKDFATSLDLDPRRLSALYQTARLLAELTNRSDEALKAFNTVIDLYPDFLDARGERGLLLARRLERLRAYADAIFSLKQDPTPRRYYQAARIYSLTAKEMSRDRPAALELLSFALRNGHGWERFENEPDFAAIGNDPEFQKLVAIAPVLGRGVPARMRLPGKNVDGD